MKFLLKSLQEMEEMVYLASSEQRIFLKDDLMEAMEVKEETSSLELMKVLIL